ncbi:MAG: YciI family protein [Deltaproteobacteria bacterium]|nr:YciI family protein [Deltaproteobacteria bacterium]
MRFMMLMIPKVYAGPTDPNFTPPVDAVEKMTKYNEQLAKAGVLISLDGLHPPEKAARVHFDGARPRVQDGPFAESKEMLGGYWIIQAKSREEAIEWARRVPAASGDIVEVRQVFDMADFPPDVRAAADNETVNAAIGVAHL